MKAAGELQEVRLLLGGDSLDGTLRLRLFGYEAGAPAPFLERDLIEPIAVRKSQRGLQWVTVTFPQPLRLDYRQFFVAVDQLSEGLFLVTDADVKPVCCQDQSEEWRYQCLKTVDGRWWTGQYGFAIEAVMNYDHDPALTWLMDKTAEAGLLDTSEVVGGIAWADYNKDSYLDLLVNGRLYKNQGGQFVDVTDSVGLSGRPLASAFIDINNDSWPDIVFLGDRDSTLHGTSRLFIASEHEKFAERSLDIPVITNPTSLSIADADLNGLLDLFIGQGRDAEGKELSNLLLLNEGKNHLVDRSDLLYQKGESAKASQGSQWVDIDGNGFLDLYIVNQGANTSEVWRSNGDGTFVLLYGSGRLAPNQLMSVNTVGGSWSDIDADGNIDLLAPQHVTLQGVAGQVESIHSVGIRSNESVSSLSFHQVDGVEFSERSGSGMWGDIDNDGNADLFLTSTSPCRPAGLFMGTDVERYTPNTSEYGLLHTPAGPDGIWVDYDNDGRLDLATFVKGRFRLFRNGREGSGNWASFDIEGQDGTGMKVEVYAGEKKISRDVTSGRGLLMQDPLRLHFGLGGANRIDSVVLTVPGGSQAHYTEIGVNQLNKLRVGDGVGSSGHLLSGISAYPNPFNEEVRVSFTLAEKSPVRIEIFDVSGNTLGIPLDEVRDVGTHTISWRAVDSRGNQLPQGTYIYRIEAGSDTYMGRVVHGR
ncbi:MAG: FG-GAP-like repeat-containing protein [Candidatus Kapaibacterium sp.]